MVRIAQGNLTYRRACRQKALALLERGRITVQLTSCLTSLEMYFALILRIVLSSFEYISKLVKEEVSRTAILPLQESERAFLCARL